jgi:large subunit ribosomal protein L24
MTKFKIKKGDNVMVIAGNSKGQSGRVLVVNKDKGRAIVEGVNLISKHTKPNADNPKGGIIKQEAAVDMSNLMITDAAGKPSRIGIKKDDKSEKNVRFSKKSGEVIK